MNIELGRPVYLLLLLLVPVMAWGFLRARGGRLAWPDRLALVLRALLVAAVALALCDPRWVETVEGRATAIVQDISDSVPADRREEAAAWTDRVLLDRKPEREDVAHIVFADGTGIERPFQGLGGLRPEDIRPIDTRRTGSIVARSETDVAAALKAAVASFPPEAARRVLLLTDGNETRGDAAAVVRELVDSKAEVLVYPLRFNRRNEVLVEKVVAPPHVRAGVPVEVRAVVVSTEEGIPATIAFRDGAGREISRSDVVLHKGRNAFRIRQQFEEQGLHLVRASVEGVPGDGDPANNRGTSAVFAEGSPAVLVAAKDPAEAENLRKALLKSDLFVNLVPLAELPPDPGSLLPYECVVLMDAPASELSAAQQRTLRSAVEETGIGLIAVGGPNSFSAGAWGGTPLEEVLPVTMDVSQKRVLPNGACVVVLHTCEFPQGNDWARTIAKSVVRTLGRKDWFGCVDYENGEMSHWVVPLSQGDRGAMMERLNNANPCDMPSLADCIGSGVAALEKTNAYLKHMIVVSDGDPMLPGKEMIDRMVKDGITISAVAIAQHGALDAMRAMTVATGGRYYALNEGEVQTLPAIFMKEAATVRRSTVFEEPFRPQVAAIHEILKGISQEEIPPLGGYVVTTAKERAEVVLVQPDPEKADPVLAVWRKGLGVAAAFTSDFTGRWGKEWLGWDKYDRFVTQLVRSCSRGIQKSTFSAMVEASGGRGTVVVEAVDAAGNYVDGLSFTGAVIAPTGESRPLRVLQTAQGRYEATFPATDTGLHLLSLEHEVQGGKPGEKLRAQIRAALPVDYSPEHLALESDEAFFERLKAAGAKILTREDRPFKDPLPETRSSADAWRWALLFAVLLFPIEVAARRLRLDPGPMIAALRERVGRFRGRLPAMPRPKPRGPVVVATDALATAGSAGKAAEEAAAAAKKPEPGAPAAAGDSPGPAKDGASESTYDLLKAKRKARRQSRWEET